MLSSTTNKRWRPLITVLDKMIAVDLLKTLLSVWTVIVIIIVSREFINVMNKAIDGQVSNETLLIILALKAIVTAVALLPAATFMAILMVLGRLYRDQEMAAIASAGGGANTIYRSVLLLILPLTLITTVLSLWLAPSTETRIEQLLHQDKQSADLRGIAAGKFTEYSQGDLVFYVEKISADKTMHHVFVQHRTHGKVAIITAKSARFEVLAEGYYLVFNQGERTQGEAGKLDYIIEKFASYAIRMDEIDTVIQFPRVAIPSNQLAVSTNLGDIAELQRRFNLPLCLLLLSFLAVPLAQISPRGGVYSNIFVGFLIYVSYGNFAHLSQVWVTRATIPVWLGGLAINSFLLFIGSFLLARLHGWRWLALKLKGLA